jgi:hypothetical protein
VTFEEVLQQAIAMLQRQGRVSYRAFKRQFALDDDYFADLKEAMLYAYPQVVDEAGRGLVGPGAASTVPEPAPLSLAPSPPPAAQGEQSVQAEPPSTAPPPDTERRHVTVLFCDLVDSTKLAGQLDPEDWREVVRAYQQTGTEVVQRFDGHVAQLLGGGTRHAGWQNSAPRWPSARGIRVPSRRATFCWGRPC